MILQLDKAALVLAQLSEPIVIAKLNADKYTKLAAKYEIEYILFILVTLISLKRNHVISIN